MINVALLDVRVIVAAIITSAAATKLLRRQSMISDARVLVRIVGLRTSKVILPLLAASEIALAMVILAGPKSTWAWILVGGFAAAATAYGVANIKVSGTCGCATIVDPRGTAALAARNAVLFGAALIAIVYGLPLSETEPRSTAVSVGALPWLLLIGLVVARYLGGGARRRHEWRALRARFDT